MDTKPSGSRTKLPMNTEPQTTWRLEELTLGDARQLNWQVAVLPMGATEPHNLHLPYGTDSYEAWHLADRCCQRANAQSSKVVQLPVMPYGTETNLQAFPFALNLQPSTLSLVLRDLVESIQASGIRKLLILNSHGGNDFKPFLREMYGKTKVQIFLCNWYQMIRDVAGRICTHPDDHAGEMETSLIMTFRPDLIRWLDETQAEDSPAHSSDARKQVLAADQGATRPFKFEALRQGWVGISRPWHLLTTNSGAGNPHQASAATGEQLAAAIVDRLAPFLAELADSDIDAYFPFGN